MNIEAKDFKVGKGVVMAPSARITGLNGQPAEYVEIGDHTFIGENVLVMCPEFKIGDYGKIHHDTNIHGYKHCHIGHNLWCGQFTIIDCIGGTTIGNNVGIGAHSQLWSHIKFGDVVQGCRFNSVAPLVLEDDVWLVGHCIVSPGVYRVKSMALVGSIVTNGMEENTVYAGVPASPKINLTQFKEVSLRKKLQSMLDLLEEFGGKNIIVVTSGVNMDDEFSYFNITTRKYTKKGTDEEVAFMKFLLSRTVKFTPY